MPPLDVSPLQYGGSWASANTLVFTNLMKVGPTRGTPLLQPIRLALLCTLAGYASLSRNLTPKRLPVTFPCFSHGPYVLCGTLLQHVWRPGILLTTLSCTHNIKSNIYTQVIWFGIGFYLRFSFRIYPHPTSPLLHTRTHAHNCTRSTPPAGPSAPGRRALTTPGVT